MAQLGEVAYTAFAHARSWKTFTGETMPAWDMQQRNIREAWQQSAEAVIKATFASTDNDEEVQRVLAVLIQRHLDENAPA